METLADNSSVEGRVVSSMELKALVRNGTSKGAKVL